MGRYSEIITKINTFINKYNWEEVNILSEKDGSKKFEKDNRKIALNVLYSKEEKLYPAYISKYNPNRKKRLFF